MPPAVARPRAPARPNLARSRSAASLSRRRAVATTHPAAPDRRNATPRNHRPHQQQQPTRPAPSPHASPPNLVRSKSASSVGTRSRASSRRHVAPPANNRQRYGNGAPAAIADNAGGGMSARQRQYQYQHQQALYQQKVKSINPSASQYHLQPVALNASSANGAGASSIAARKASRPILKNPATPPPAKEGARPRQLRWNLFAKKNTASTPTPAPTTAPTVTTPNPVPVQQQLRQQQLVRQLLLQKSSSGSSTNSLVIRTANNPPLPLTLRSNNVPAYRSPSSQARGGKSAYGSVVRYNAAANGFRNGNANRNNRFGNTRTMRSIRYQGTAPNGMAMRRMVNYSAARTGMRPVPIGLFPSSKGSSAGDRLILIDGRSVGQYDEGASMPYGFAGVFSAINYYSERRKDWIVLVDDDSYCDWDEEAPEIVGQLRMGGKLITTPSESDFTRFLARIGADLEADIITNEPFFMEKQNQIDPMLLRSALDRLVIPFVIIRQRFIPHPDECRIIEGLHGPRPPVPQIGEGDDGGMDPGMLGPGMGRPVPVMGPSPQGPRMATRMRSAPRIAPLNYRGGDTLPAAYRVQMNRGGTTNARMAAYRRAQLGGRR